jgi:hypothetical protein
MALVRSFVLVPLIAAVVLASVSGCATIVSGSKQDVSFNSNPQAAEVLVYQGYAPEVAGPGTMQVFVGRTPALASLPRNKEYTAVVRAPGYTEVRVKIDKNFNYWVIGNICCAGIVVGGLIDYATGSFFKLDPDDIMVTLVPSAGGVPPVLPGVPGMPGPAAPGMPAAPAGLVPSPAAQFNGGEGSASDVDMYAVFVARDSEGQLRSISIPMIRDHGAGAPGKATRDTFTWKHPLALPVRVGSSIRALVSR